MWSSQLDPTHIPKSECSTPTIAQNRFSHFQLPRNLLVKLSESHDGPWQGHSTRSKCGCYSSVHPQTSAFAPSCACLKKEAGGTGSGLGGRPCSGVAACSVGANNRVI